jgi:hypothetical protein
MADKKQPADDKDLSKLRNARVGLAASKKKVDDKVKAFEREAARVRKA